MFTLESIDELIEKWTKELEDLSPNNVDSMDRHVEPSQHTCYEAIRLLPEVLKELKDKLHILKILEPILQCMVAELSMELEKRRKVKKSGFFRSLFRKN